MDSIHDPYIDALDNVQEAFERDGHILLQKFLSENAYAKIRASLLHNEWREEYVPDMHRYVEGTLPEDVSDVLDSVKQYIEKVAKTPLNLEWFALRKYGKGSFTLQHDEQPPNGLFVTLTLCDGWSEEMRGELVIIGEDQIIVPPQDNQCFILTWDDHEHYVKRVSHHAKKHSLFALHLVFR